MQQPARGAHGRASARRRGGRRRSSNVDQNMRLLLGGNYLRLDPQLPWRIGLGDVRAPRAYQSE